jgi:hypothetical protein
MSSPTMLSQHFLYKHRKWDKSLKWSLQGHIYYASRMYEQLPLTLLLFSIVKIGLQQFSWTTDTWDIR